MDKISFPYRSAMHLTLLHVVAESGAWEKHGLKVEYDRPISKADAHKSIASGEIEFVSGSHVSTYGHRARGDKWVYLGQTVNAVRPKLAVLPDSGIQGIPDLRGRKIGTQGAHPGLNDWLYLKQRGLDVDRDAVELINRSSLRDRAGLAKPKSAGEKPNKHEPLWQWVIDKKVDAVFLVEPPDNLFAEEAGLKIIDLEPMPMIWFTTISSSLPFVEKNPDLVQRFLKGLIEGIHFFKTQPERSISIIESRMTEQGPLNRAKAAYAYQLLAPQVEPKLYPTMAAIANVYEEGKREDIDAKKINPLQLWDMHHVRQIDDSGFIDSLYSDARCELVDRSDLDYIQELTAKRAEVIAAIKACGHLETESCTCED